LKLKKSTPGEPFDTRFANYNHLLGECSVPLIETWLEEVISDVEGGGDGYVPLFRAHTKADRYSEKKRSTAEWRIILGSDVVCLFLFQMFFAELNERAELEHPRVGVFMSPARWDAIVVRRLATRKTAGVDYSNYDQTESCELLAVIVRELALAVGCSEKMAEYLACCAAHGWGVTCDGVVVERAGGNPSGQYLTSVLNSLYHEVINFTCWAQVLDIDEDSVLGHVDWCVVGDDELVAPTSASDLKDFVSESGSRFGIVVKADLVDGQLYPVGAHASFLSKVTVLVSEHILVLPSEPTRLLSSWQVPHFDETDAVEIYRGLLSECWGYRMIVELGLPWPVPRVVLDFFLDATRLEAATGRVLFIPLKDLLAQRTGVTCE